MVRNMMRKTKHLVESEMAQLMFMRTHMYDGKDMLEEEKQLMAKRLEEKRTQLGIGDNKILKSYVKAFEFKYIPKSQKNKSPDSHSASDPAQSKENCLVCALKLKCKIHGTTANLKGAIVK